MTLPTEAVHQADVMLAQAILARDRKATARLVELHTDAVHGYVRRRLAPKVDLVDDLVQEAFVAAWKSLRSYSGESSLRTWLLGIARNKIEDHYRRTLSRPMEGLESCSEAELCLITDPGSDLDGERGALRSARILTELPYAYATALRWRYWDNRSARQMAEVTGQTEKAIERLLARAREQFKRRWLQAEGRSS